MQIKPEDDRCARWKRFLRIRSSRIGVWCHIKPFMPLFQLIERYPLGIECASKKCVALYDGLIFFFSQRVIKFILGENGWIHGPVRGIFLKALYGAHVGCGKMSRMPLYARTFPHSAELVGFVQAVNGRHWVGIGMEGKRYLACGCGRGRMGTGADYLLNDIPFQESSSRMIDFYS